jgi:putative nucleotidyltransferase with HDIG domain
MVAVVSFVTDGRIRRNVIEPSAHAHAEVLAIHRLGSAVSTVEAALRQLVTARDHQRPARPLLQDGQLRAARAALDAALIEARDAVRAVAEPSEVRARLSAEDGKEEHDELLVLGELASALERLEAGARALDARIVTLSPEAADQLAGALLTDIGAQIAPRLRLVAEDAQAEMAKASDAFVTTMRAARRLEMAAIMTALLLALLVGTLTARAIFTPLAALRDAALRIGRGELGTPVSLPARDEMSVLGDALEQMGSDLQRTMARLTDTLRERDRAQAALLEFNASLEKTVEERTARLQQVIDASPFGAALYELFPYGRLVFMGANRSADRILHVDTKQFIGKTIEEAFPALADTPLPEQCRSTARSGPARHVGPIAYNENGITGSYELDLVPLGQNRMAVFFRDITELVRAYDETLAGWSRAMDLRDRETEGHTQRVTEMTVALARAMGMSETDIVQVRWGALLHDIGKIGVPDSILLKPGPLNEDEWAVMRRHPETARDMLAPIGFLTNALAIPYCHHERWDGSGYPRGLVGAQIPLAARIFAVADVWDALRSQRSYHRPWPLEEVLAYIRSQSGRQFDPDVVSAFDSLAVQIIADERRSRFERAG